ncbi:hypothetical protein AALP_AA3G242800 [Arabis alpina]|uniref:F-box domain-containing protein n=1 Tax=Arabis alpina TaxID=50452 RepID=A0A087HBC0_ARAAL|nr:hypothetical protein AALP_AA3G242800 [Arabis alpina]
MMKKKRGTVEELPEELVVEILSRVPTVSLARFKSISKKWNGLIKDRRFTKKHSANAPRQSLVILLKNFRVYLVTLDLNAPSAKVTSQLSLKGDPFYCGSEEQVDINEVFHCDGLLLCTTTDYRLVVWNPSSGESVWIKPMSSYRKTDVYALGYDKESSGYKILRLNRFFHDFPFRTEFEVYDLTSNSWKGVGETNDWFIPLYLSRGVFLKGSVYWLALSQSVSFGDRILTSFDFSTETFRSQSLPYKSVTALSVGREEQLFLPNYLDRSDDLHVWMTSKIESSGIVSWTKFLTANTNFRASEWTSFLADEDSKSVVCCNASKVPNHILHIVGENRYLQVDLHGAKLTCPLLLSYVPTLAQIQQGKELLE